MEKMKTNLLSVLFCFVLLGFCMDATAKDNESDVFLKAVAAKETAERQAKIAEATKDISISYEYKSRTFSYSLAYEVKEQDLTKKAVGATVFSLMAGMIQDQSKDYAVMVLLETDLKNAGFLENMMAAKASFKVTVKGQMGISQQEKVSAKEVKQFADMSREKRTDYYLTMNCEQVNKIMLPIDEGTKMSIKSIAYQDKNVVLNMVLDEQFFEMVSVAPECFKSIVVNKFTQQFASQLEYFTGDYVFAIQNGVVRSGRLQLPYNPQTVRLKVTAADRKAMEEHPLDDTDNAMYGKVAAFKMLISQNKKKGEKMELTGADYHDRMLFLVHQSQDEHMEQLISRVGNHKGELDTYRKGYLLKNEKYFKEDADSGVGVHITFKNGMGDSAVISYAAKELLALYALPQYERDSITCGFDFLHDNVTISSKHYGETDGIAFFPQTVAYEGNNIVMTFIAKGQKEFKYYSMGLTTKGYELLRKMDKLRSACTKLRKNFVYRVVSKDGKQKRQEVISWVDIR